MIIKDLTEHGDHIYAGISDNELFQNSLKLGFQMVKGSGHFYYAEDTEETSIRVDKLAKSLYEKGLR